MSLVEILIAAGKQNVKSMPIGAQLEELATLPAAPEHEAAKQRAFWVHKAKAAEQAERYEEMVEYMNEIINMGLKGDELEQDERNLISVGYKNMMSNRRTAWRVAQNKLEQDMEGLQKDAPQNAVELVEKYKNTIGAEVDKIIEKVMVEVVKPYTSGPTAATKGEYLVFFHKMEGDYYRYGAEKSEKGGAQCKEYTLKSKQAYEKARECGENSNPPIGPTNPIFLGLGLNQSVFHYEICGEKEAAKELAKKFFEQALEELDKLPEEQYKDATLIMQLLKENLTLWDGDTEEEGDEGDLLVEDA